MSYKMANYGLCMHLDKFIERDYPQLISWISSEEFNYLWGGPVYKYPLTIKQITAHVSKAEVTPLMLRDNELEIGYIELHRESESTYRLCRVLIADESVRGKGYGKVLVNLAIDHAKKAFNATTINLAVFEHNQNAVNCYQSLGFNVIRKEAGLRSFNGDRWNLLYMELNNI